MRHTKGQSKPVRVSFRKPAPTNGKCLNNRCWSLISHLSPPTRISLFRVLHHLKPSLPSTRLISGNYLSYQVPTLLHRCLFSYILYLATRKQSKEELIYIYIYISSSCWCTFGFTERDHGARRSCSRRTSFTWSPQCTSFTRSPSSTTRWCCSGATSTQCTSSTPKDHVPLASGLLLFNIRVWLWICSYILIFTIS